MYMLRILLVMIRPWLSWGSSCPVPLCLAPSCFCLCLCNGLDHDCMPPPLMVLPLLLFFLCHCPPPPVSEPSGSDPAAETSCIRRAPACRAASPLPPPLTLLASSTLTVHHPRPRAVCAFCYSSFLLSTKRQAVRSVPSKSTPVPKA